MQDFVVESTLQNGAWLVSMRGEARVESSNRLVHEVSRILEEEPADVLLDCEQLQFLDSASTGALLRVASDVQKHDRRVALFGLSPVVQRVLDVTRLAERFAIAPSETEARALLTER